MKKLILLLAVALACASAHNSHYDQQISVQLGQTVTFPNQFALTFTHVVSDSRCPVNVTCIQKGDAVVELTAQSNGQHEAVNLDFDHRPHVVVLGHAIELQSVAAANPYSITITVRSNAM
jgi:methionine-rich copper-binding protein CopC